MSTVAGAMALPKRARGLRVLWRFSRPHTVIGTTLSVVALWLITLTNTEGSLTAARLGDLALTLLAAYAVNVFIVGINQIEDVDIDRVNKPFLPIAAGDLSLRVAWWIVGVSAALPVLMALTQGVIEVVSVMTALLVGAAYSVPPIRLKRHAGLAMFAISGVRSIVVNLGVSLHFALTYGADPVIAPSVIALTLFVIPFSVAIAILKDVPDLEGDRRFQIATYTVRLGPERVMRLGLAALTTAYLGMAILGAWLLPDVQPALFVAAHLAALALLWRWASRVDCRNPHECTTFYMRIWKLFFLEYVLVPVAVLAA